MLANRAVVQSMSRKGNCLDNTAMESFFGTLKSEFFYLNRFESIKQRQANIRQYIHYHNHDHIKLKLKGLSPVQYRTQAFCPWLLTVKLLGVNSRGGTVHLPHSETLHPNSYRLAKSFFIICGLPGHHRYSKTVHSGSYCLAKSFV